MTSKARLNADKDLVDREEVAELAVNGATGDGESGKIVTDDELAEALENQDLDGGLF